MLKRADDFELAIDPDCNIVCFRYAPKGVIDLDALGRERAARLAALARQLVPAWQS